MFQYPIRIFAPACSISPFIYGQAVAYLQGEVDAVKRYKWLVVGAMVLLAMVAGAMVRAAPDPGVAKVLNELYAARAQALVTGAAPKGLEDYYDLSTQGGRFALAHELGRINYVQAWAPARQLQVVDAATLVTNLRIKLEGDKATVSLISRTKLGYKYGGLDTVNQMGTGSWHWLEMTRKGDRWLVAREFYLDAMGDEWTQPFVPADKAPPKEVAPPTAAAARGRIDREGARAYAETYCGAAWGCGNNSDYNQRYQSYKNLGGDCANFASQVLTEGGKLKPDWVWKRGGKGAGSACWVNAQSFVKYLQSSGRGSLVARGKYAQVEPALSKLKPGDIVGYQRKGTITHVSVITGVDSAGVPVVAAHTADRFRNPWDLGWDKDTIFWLIHLRD
jgi:hypothetical protein